MNNQAPLKISLATHWLTFINLFLLIAIGNLPAIAQERSVNIVFIGNSITYGAGLAERETSAPPIIAGNWLKQHGIKINEISNQGHSGYTTLDFLPGTPAFVQVVGAAKAFKESNAQLIFSIKLGTNDSAIQGPHGAPVSPQDYIINLKTITNELLKNFPQAIIIYQHPVWYSPNTYNGAKYLQEGLNRLQSYIPLIDSLAKAYANSGQGRVFIGDKQAFDYFRANYLTDFQAEPGNQGTFYLHPNEKGAQALGQFWGKAIYEVVKKL